MTLGDGCSNAEGVVPSDDVVLSDTTSKILATAEPGGSPLPALTGLRFIAAFYVVLLHSVPWLVTHFRLPGQLTIFLDNGYLAVCLFFLLSGFILSYTYARHSSTGIGRRKFWVARLARVYPVYFLSLILALPFEIHQLSWGQALSVIFMFQAWNPLSAEGLGAWNYPAWSLSVEAFFYLCFPFLQTVLWQLSWRTLLAIGLLAGLLCVFFHTPTEGLGSWNPAVAGKWLPLPVLRLPEFVLGMVLGNVFVRTGPVTRVVALGPLALLASILVLSATLGPWVSLIVVPFSLLIYSLTFSKNPLTPLLSNRLMVLLGGASYSIYLLQAPVRDWVRTIISNRSPFLGDLNIVLTPLVLILFSILVFQFWEEPLRKALRRKLVSGIERFGHVR